MYIALSSSFAFNLSVSSSSHITDGMSFTFTDFGHKGLQVLLAEMSSLAKESADVDTAPAKMNVAAASSIDWNIRIHVNFVNN